MDRTRGNMRSPPPKKVRFDLKDLRVLHHYHHQLTLKQLKQ